MKDRFKTPESNPVKKPSINYCTLSQLCCTHSLPSWLPRRSVTSVVILCYSRLHFPNRLFFFQVLITQSCLTLSDPMDSYVACQPPLSTDFSRQAYWSEKPIPSPGNRPNPGIEPGSPSLQADSLPSEPPGKQGFIGP